MLYKLPFPLNLTAWGRDFLAKPYQDLWDWLVPWAGKHLLGLSISIRTSGSGDKTYNYVQLLCFLILAVAVTVAWTALDRKRTEYTRLYEGLRTYIRFALAAAMLLYGAYKVIPSQFAQPFPSQLIEPFGESSPMELLWTFMDASSGYTIFAGAAEMLSGLLLAFRRTREVPADQRASTQLLRNSKRPVGYRRSQRLTQPPATRLAPFLGGLAAGGGGRHRPWDLRGGSGADQPVAADRRGTAMGIGVAAMHYTGMKAMRMQAQLSYDLVIVRSRWRSR